MSVDDLEPVSASLARVSTADSTFYEPWMAPLMDDPGATAKWFKSFPVAEHVQRRNTNTLPYQQKYPTRDRVADPEWEAHKLKGNAAFAARDYDSAVAHFTHGLQVALGPGDVSEHGGGGMSAFVGALKAWPEDSPYGQVVDNRDVLVSIVEFALTLPNPVIKNGTLIARVPNMPAAICLANRSAAHLSAGRAAEALADAKEAAETAPEYLKAHKRILVAHTALGNKKDASELKEYIAAFEAAVHVLPSAAIAMLVAGFSDWEAHVLVYEPIRQRAAAQIIRATCGDSLCFMAANFSLVPFQGGQCLMMNVHWVDEEMRRRSVEAFRFLQIDNDHGRDLELPPHGLPSSRAMQHCPMLIHKWVEEVQDDYGIQVTSVKCCQGLVELTGVIGAALERGGIKCLVQASLSTAASEDNGLTPRGFGDPGGGAGGAEGCAQQ